jgi:hypothetical protein
MNAQLLPPDAFGHSEPNTSALLPISDRPNHSGHSAQAVQPHPHPLQAAPTDSHVLPIDSGRIVLDAAALKRLRMSRLMSQQDLADDCWRRNIQISLTTIKRAEGGRAVRFRIAREFARCFGVPVTSLVEA